LQWWQEATLLWEKPQLVVVASTWHLATITLAAANYMGRKSAHGSILPMPQVSAIAQYQWQHQCEKTDIIKQVDCYIKTSCQTLQPSQNTCSSRIAIASCCIIASCSGGVTVVHQRWLASSAQ